MILLYTLLYSYIDWFVDLYRCLEISNNKLSVLPPSLYSKNRLIRLNIDGNQFSTADVSNNKPELKPEHFTTIRVQSLFHTVATSIVSKRYVQNSEHVQLVIHL